MAKIKSFQVSQTCDNVSLNVSDLVNTTKSWRGSLIPNVEDTT